MVEISLEDREAARDILNKAFEIVEADGPITTEIKVKDQDAVSEGISILQGIYEIGIDGGEGEKTAEFALNEDIKED